MDFYAEQEKRKQKHLNEIGQLSYEYYDLIKKIEDAEKRITEIDSLIRDREAKIMEVDQSQRNFNSYLAIKEGALTTEQLKESIEKGNK